ncbi:hypothetical protein SARC_06588 [Sphaeroforma arctica JP610]|uniref:BSD domain-containing protein n=1 Tax=Sphaeroforma arctica JP610 TaxID=667725 RepID=A0A0L0FWS1_9EUKA|nr:hypothetical protein SARC_06588 [Sphaeroforma arctica JP610]KNC81064.1 hypothetical protein SARC_06588 [Sphaeroforma arctica JP610]|eukprot:XP_014154966.1 hypothetical protein SARC_06588 [Sphaeroforma arctica JP610]
MSGGSKRDQASSSDWWGWGASLVADLQQQTQELVEATKSDLGVFVDTVTTESQHIAQDTASMTAITIAKHVPKEAEEFFNSLDLPQSSSRQQRQKDQPKYAPPQGARASPAKKPVARYTRRDLHILQLQSTPTTFITDPENTEAFRKWQIENPFMSQRKAEIETLRSQSNSIANMEANLVPNAVSFEVFWKRYFFQLDMFDGAVQQREEIKRAMESDLQKNDSEGWGDDDDDWSDGEKGWDEGDTVTVKDPLPSTSKVLNTETDTPHDDGSQIEIPYNAATVCDQAMERSDKTSAECDIEANEPELTGAPAAQSDISSAIRDTVNTSLDTPAETAGEATRGLANESPNHDPHPLQVTGPEDTEEAADPHADVHAEHEPQPQSHLQIPQSSALASDGVLSAGDTGSERDDETNTSAYAYAHDIESETTAFPGSETTEPELETDGDRSAWGEESEDTLYPNWSHAEDQGQSDGKRANSANVMEEMGGDDQWDESAEDGWGESAAEDGAALRYVNKDDGDEDSDVEESRNTVDIQQEDTLRGSKANQVQQAGSEVQSQAPVQSPKVDKEAAAVSEGSDSDWEKWE